MAKFKLCPKILVLCVTSKKYLGGMDKNVVEKHISGETDGGTPKKKKTTAALGAPPQ